MKLNIEQQSALVLAKGIHLDESRIVIVPTITEQIVRLFPGFQIESDSEVVWEREKYNKKDGPTPFREAFTVREIAFGTDETYSDGGFYKKMNRVGTFFMFDGLECQVFLEPESDIDKPGQWWNLNFSTRDPGGIWMSSDKIVTHIEPRRILRFYGTLMYVVDKVTSNFGIRFMAFQSPGQAIGEPDPRTTVYTMLAKNASFVSVIAQSGWKIQPFEDYFLMRKR